MAKRKTSARATKDGKVKTTTRTRRTRTSGTTAAGRGVGLRGASIRQLEAEIERRQGSLSELKQRRTALKRELRSVEREIAALNGAGRTRRTAGGGARPRNKHSLVDALRGVLRNSTLSVSEAAEAVQLAGYKTTSSNFRTIVNQAIIANPERFKKVAHGRYTSA